MIVKRDFIYTPTKQNRPLHIYLPKGYEESGERYPVMYFFDGHNLFSDSDATYGKSWGIKDFLDAWDKPMIVVGIECGHGDGERLSEYLPYDVSIPFGKNIRGIGDATLDWIIHELKPVIDREYRTIPFRECTGVGGSSMGGLMALYTVIRHNMYFSKAACLSSYVGPCMDPLMKDMDEYMTYPDTRVYLSRGEKEMHADSKGWDPIVAHRIRTYGAVAKTCVQTDGGHNEASWEKLVPEFMHFLWRT